MGWNSRTLRRGAHSGRSPGIAGLTGMLWVAALAVTAAVVIFVVWVAIGAKTQIVDLAGHPRPSISCAVAPPAPIAAAPSSPSAAPASSTGSCGVDGIGVSRSHPAGGSSHSHPARPPSSAGLPSSPMVSTAIGDTAPDIIPTLLIGLLALLGGLAGLIRLGRRHGGRR